ncbi:MAG: arginine deiminase [Lewinellaceae bacterium]|nr:arginine deiminase [Phaeodactylibacter sp.]MCB9349697.1 arginine deiminase [Lewinellaceae bacterium]
MTNQVHVSSEIGALRRVIVHRPDEGIARISPKRAEELLFDDIVYLPKMQEEHDIFTNVLRAFVGNENVLGTTNLLREALRHDEESKQEMLTKIVDYEELPTSYRDMLLEMPDELLAKVLVNGYYPEEDIFLFDPIPNFIFTRDIAVTVNNHIVITKPAKEARFRENYLTRFIIWAHPIFRELRETDRIINMNRVDEFPPSRRGEMISIEGGDMMVLNKDYLLIGCSERTTEYAVKSLKDALLQRDVIKHVVQVNIPNDRSYMHIDTVFTQISRNHLVAYKPIVEDGLGSYVTVYGQDGVERHYPTVKEFILSEINSKMQFIWSGDGESPYQEREQWTDGCNLVALKPGVALTYDRNPMTEKAFEKAGYRTAHARELLAAFRDGIIKPEEIKDTIILLPSNELSRARGGSHCMTCPIERDDL